MRHKLRQNSLEIVHQEDRFWTEHYPKLQRYCHFLTQNPWDGDDIAHETFLKVQKCYPHQNVTSALLNKIAYHHWVDILRKRKKETIEHDCGNQAFTNPCDDVMGSVELLLNQFTPKQAVIFMLKEAFHYQLKEIANIMETTEMAVKANLHRAKKRKENEQSFSMEPFWNEEEREQLSDLFYKALKNQDPSVLIQALPSIKSIVDVPKMVVKSPVSTLYMAA